MQSAVEKDLSPIRNHKDLIVWQKSIALVKSIYEITEHFPQKERYRLVDQLCRAAISIPSNIAEGSSRKSTKEFIRYINIAHGPLAEVETQLIVAFELGYVGEKNLKPIFAQIVEIGKMLNALHNALQKKLTALRTPHSVLSES